MLCQKCWIEEARIHFACLCGGEVQHLNYCLACAQDEPLSWLLAWGHSLQAPTQDDLRIPLIVDVKPEAGAGGRERTTLVATRVLRCECGCRIVVAATMPCTHGTYVFGSAWRTVAHECHCGREHTILVPEVACMDCGAFETLSVVGTAQTCSWDEQRRRLVAIDSDLQRGRATWGTFSVLN